MIKFSLPLRNDRQRPTVCLDNFANSYVMLDTGALIPVWCGEEKIFQDLGAVFVASGQSFGGFGGTATGTLYRLPLFRFCILLFPNLPVIVSRYNLPCQMILSATMFKGLAYEVDDGHHLLSVTVPDGETNVRHLKVTDKNGRVHVLCTGDNDILMSAKLKDYY